MRGILKGPRDPGPPDRHLLPQGEKGGNGAQNPVHHRRDDDRSLGGST